MSKGYLLAGELAKLTGVSTDTLRYYERKGVLEKPPRSAKGYRLYPTNAVKQVKVIRAALLIGFGLKELAKVFSQNESGKARCEEVRQITLDKFAEIEQRLKSLTIFRDELHVLLQDWDKELSKTTKSESAKLLEKLVDSNNFFTYKNPSSLNFKSKELKKNEE